MWISLIGFMASGKSTVTRRFDTLTSRLTVCLDDQIVRSIGLSIPEIFEQHGQDYFRQQELAAVQSLSTTDNLVVDTGGGIVETPAAVALLRSHGPVIWLDPPWEIIRARLKSQKESPRPLFDSLDWAQLEHLYIKRRTMYAASADFRFSGSDWTADQLVRTTILRSLVWNNQQQESQ